LFIDNYSERQRARIASHNEGELATVPLMVGATIGRNTRILDRRDDEIIITAVPRGTEKRTIAWLYHNVVVLRKDLLSLDEYYHHEVEEAFAEHSATNYATSSGMMMEVDSRQVMKRLRQLTPCMQAFSKFAWTLATRRLSLPENERLLTSVSMADDVIILRINRTVDALLPA
jgi:hypothetical protein